MVKQTSDLLTEAELELMLILWRLGEGTVKDILAALPADRHMAYTTASTIVRIMERKGFVQSRKAGRGHSYSPVISKEDYESRTLGHVVNTLFDRTPASLVARLVNDKKLTAADMEEIRRLLDQEDES